MSTQPAFDHSGSSFDSLLEEEGILDEAEAAAIKRVRQFILETGENLAAVIIPHDEINDNCDKPTLL
jgi:hypothetical protein